MQLLVWVMDSADNGVKPIFFSAPHNVISSGEMFCFFRTLQSFVHAKLIYNIYGAEQEHAFFRNKEVKYK